MKRAIVIILGCLVVGAAIFAFVGPAHWGVAKDQLLGQIDKLLGETEVQKKQIELQVGNARKAVETLAEAKIKAQVRSEQMAKKVAAQEEKLNELKTYLATLRDHLGAEQPVVLAGKTYSKDELKALADKVIKLHKEGSAELESLKRSQANLDLATASLADRHKDANSKLVAMENRVREFDAKIEQLKAMREARQAVGDRDLTLAANFQQLEKQIDDLHAKTEAELRLEEERWKTLNPARELDEIERIVIASKGLDGTLSEIDRILGKK
jgi:chromosome segregation ATPase